MSTALEVKMRVHEYQRRAAPMLARMNQIFREVLAIQIALASRRRRKSKGWRKHVRRTKAQQR